MTQWSVFGYSLDLIDYEYSSVAADILRRGYVKMLAQPQSTFNL